MSRAKKKYVSRMKELRKRFKKPFWNIALLMPRGFTNDCFLAEFRRCYGYLWDDICATYRLYNAMDKGRVRKGFDRIYNFPQPEACLRYWAFHCLKRIRRQHELGQVCTKEEQTRLRDGLMKACKKKMQKRAGKKEYNQRYVQYVKPKYTNYFIQEYFEGKNHSPHDVDKRMMILTEVARYHCKATVKFLYKVNAAERNYHLRHFAFTTLQKFGKTGVIFRGNRKGKKHLGDQSVPEVIDSPQKLLYRIYHSQMEEQKTYDMFISHSYKDCENLLDLKTFLNASKLHVYLDWVCDREALGRDLTNKDTAEVILRRLEQSESLLYVYTPSCSLSQWAPWELGYFQAFHRPIFVYIPEEEGNVQKPPYLDLYPRVYLKDGKLGIDKEGGFIPLALAI